MVTIKEMKISDIVIDAETYPRMHPDWVTVARYHNAMKSGAKFPPITVGVLQGKAYLIDGNHRIQASKSLKRTRIKAELLRMKDKRKIYFEAVKRNIHHGKQFSTQEVSGIIINLKSWKLKPVEISKLVGIPIDRLQLFISKRLTRVVGSKETLPLKKSLRNLAGTEQASDFDKQQDNLIGTSQGTLLDNLIVLFENDWLDTSDEKIGEKLSIIYGYLEALPIKPVKQ